MSAQPSERWTAADFRRDADRLQAELDADMRAEARDAADDDRALWFDPWIDEPSRAELAEDALERRRRRG